MKLTVIEIYEAFQNVYAKSDDDFRYLINDTTEGLDYSKLKMGQKIEATKVTARGFVLEAHTM